MVSICVQLQNKWLHVYMVSICSQLQNEGLYGLNLLNYNRKTWVKSLCLIYLLMSRWNPGKNIVSKCPFAYRKMQLFRTRPQNGAEHSDTKCVLTIEKNPHKNDPFPLYFRPLSSILGVKAKATAQPFEISPPLQCLQFGRGGGFNDTRLDVCKLTCQNILV